MLNLQDQINVHINLHYIQTGWRAPLEEFVMYCNSNLFSGGPVRAGANFDPKILVTRFFSRVLSVLSNMLRSCRNSGKEGLKSERMRSAAPLLEPLAGSYAVVTSSVTQLIILHRMHAVS